MGRRIARAQDPQPPSDWPDWLLAPAVGYFPGDELRRYQELVRFRRWQERRRRWFAEHGMPLDWLGCAQERRRRATAEDVA